MMHMHVFEAVNGSLQDIMAVIQDLALWRLGCGV
jgi:hypothetical protein